MILRPIRPEAPDYRDQIDRLCRRSVTTTPAPEVERDVRAMVAAVRERGDAAVRELTEKLDHRSPGPDGSYEISRQRWHQQAAEVAPEVRRALERAAGRIREFHRHQVEAGYRLRATDTRMGLRVAPLQRVGIYVPGGTARYPSSVLMTAIPARVAGVAEVVMVTPGASAETLAAAEIAGVDRVFEIGGAQAVAALAFGTATVPRVDKIVGPGNQWVAEAKRLVFGEVDIDSVAGPSEVLVVADDGADPGCVAADLLAQAEHDVDARPILVTTSAALADAVDGELATQLADLPRREIAATSLARHGVAVVVEGVSAALEIADRYAPEHLELQLREPAAAAERVATAGAIFVGPYTPEAAGDYLAGPNHVLPTGGAARYASPLGVYDFYKRTTVLEYRREALADQLADIVTLAEVEGLSAHGRSAARRFAERDAAARELESEVAADPLRLPDSLRGLVTDGLEELPAYKVPPRRPTRAKLDSNELPYPLPPEVAAALAAELATVDLHRYPAGDCRELRQVVAAELGVGPGSLVFGNGSGELINFLLQVFGRPRPGQRAATVLYPVPTFVFYHTACLAQATEPIEVPLGDDFALEPEPLEAAIERHRPNLAFFARPNNPTGTLWSRAVIEELAERHPDLIVVVDEAYIDYGGDTMIDQVDRFPNLVIVRTLSKLGLAGLRVGFLHAREAVAHQLEKVRPPYNLGALNQHTAAWLLGNHRELLAERCRQVAAERDRLSAVLAALPGIQVFDSQANLLLLRFRGGEAPATAVWNGLAERGVSIRRFPGFESLRDCLRITVGSPEENQILLEALREVLAGDLLP